MAIGKERIIGAYRALNNPKNRVESVGRQVTEAVGGKMIGGWYCLGEYDVILIADVPNIESMAAIAVAIAECDEHGWIQDRADPYAREYALAIASEDPPRGVSPDEAAAEISDVLESIGDTCPECPPEPQ